MQLRCEDGENCYSPRSFYTITIIDNQGGCQTILCVRGNSEAVCMCTVWVVHLEGDVTQKYKGRMLCMCIASVLGGGCGFQDVCLREGGHE